MRWDEPLAARAFRWAESRGEEGDEPVVCEMTWPTRATGSRKRPTRLGQIAGVLAAIALATACGGPAEPTAETSSAGGKPVFAHVHGLGVDPADGRTYVATHHGLFRAGADGRLEPVAAVGRDLMGFTVAGPRMFLSSGHPGPGEDVADPLGLVRSTDGGRTWSAVSLAGEVDFHALEVSAGTVFGLDAVRQVLRVSADGGATWQDRAALPALDVAVDPRNPASVLATVRGGVSASHNGGTTFSPPSGPQLAFVSWAPDGTAYGLGLDGGLHTSDDRGGTWRRVGDVPGGRPQAITGLDKVHVLAATTGGIHESRDGGRTFTRIT